MSTSRLSSSAALLLSMAALAESAGNPTAGKTVFQQNCAVCHGVTGKGDGPAAAGLNPKPANFSERLASTAARQVIVVTNGGASQKLSPLMPAYGEVLTDVQIRDVVSFVRAQFMGTATR